MRKYLLLASVVLLAACTKKYETNNYYRSQPGQPPFIVSGLSNIVLVNNLSPTANLNLTLQYQDSAQEDVTLALSGLPAGVVIDTTWLHHGVPTFSTTISLYDTSSAGAIPGSYTLRLTATPSGGPVLSYPISLWIAPRPTTFLGKYTSCISDCLMGVVYTDSVYVSASDPGTIWFTNLDNQHSLAFATITATGTLTIPSQISGSHTFSGASTAAVNFNTHNLQLSVYADGFGCAVTMN